MKNDFYFTLKSPAKMKISLILAKNSRKTEIKRFPLFYMKTRASLRYLVNDFLRKHFFASNSPHTPSNLIYLTILLTLMPFKQF